MKTIKQKYLIKASIDEVWKGLTDPEYINKWGGGPARMSDKIGSKFEFWSGDIWGKVIDVVPKKKLVEEWWSEKSWKSPSIVTFTLKEVETGVEVELLHKNIPDAEFADIKSGWKDYYMGPMREYLEDN